MTLPTINIPTTPVGFGIDAGVLSPSGGSASGTPRLRSAGASGHSGTQSTQGLDGAAGLPPEAAQLSPSELILFIETALDDIDDRVRTMMSEINRRRGRAEDISRAVSTLNSLTEENNFNNDNHAEESAAHLQALRAEVEDPSVKELLDQILDASDSSDPRLVDPATGDNLDKADIERIVGDLNAELSQVEGKIQIDMIKLQSLMQERARLMTFVTNAMQALNEPLKTVVANYGRI